MKCQILRLKSLWGAAILSVPTITVLEDFKEIQGFQMLPLNVQGRSAGAPQTLNFWIIYNDLEHE